MCTVKSFNDGNNFGSFVLAVVFHGEPKGAFYEACEKLPVKIQGVLICFVKLCSSTGTKKKTRSLQTGIEVHICAVDECILIPLWSSMCVCPLWFYFSFEFSGRFLSDLISWDANKRKLKFI